MRWGVWTAALAGALGCTGLDLNISPVQATVATGSWLKITVSSSHCASSLTDSCRVTVKQDAPDIVGIDVDEDVFMIDESEGTGHTALLYALAEGTAEATITARRDAEEESRVGTYTVVNPDEVYVLKRCADDDSGPLLAGSSIPFDVRLEHDGHSLRGHGYDRLEASDGSIHVARQDGGETAYTLHVPDAPGVVSIESPDPLARPVKMTVVGVDQLDGLEVSAEARHTLGSTCYAAVRSRATVGGLGLCRDVAPRTFTVVTPDACLFSTDDALTWSGPATGIAVESVAEGACRIHVQIEGTELQDEVEFDPCGE